MLLQSENSYSQIPITHSFFQIEACQNMRNLLKKIKCSENTYQSVSTSELNEFCSLQRGYTSYRVSFVSGTKENALEQESMTKTEKT